MSLKGHSSIFESPSQRVDHIDPTTIKLLSDRALIRDLGDPTMYAGCIIIPETCRESRAQQEWGNLRIGEVLAVGPGDRWLETWVGEDGSVGRKQLMGTCPLCEGCGRTYFDIRAYKTLPGGDGKCGECDGAGKVPVCVPPQCKPGDRVLFSRRREAEFIINGDKYSLVNSEQSVVAVLEMD